MNKMTSGLPFKDQDHSGITTVQSLQYALLRAGLDPFDQIIWDEQRHVVATYGVYVVTPLADGTFSLDIRDRADVNHRGVFVTEADVVRAYLAEDDPQPPPDQDRVRAAAQRAHDEKEEWRDELKARNDRLVERVLRERAEAGLPLDPTAEDEPGPDQR